MQLESPIQTGRRLQSCAEPVSITPSAMDPQYYTITADALEYQLIPFVTDPFGCPVEYTYTVDPVSDIPAMMQLGTFDADTGIFTIFNDNNLDLVTPPARF